MRSEKLRVSLVRVGQSDGELGRAEGAEEKMELYERLMMECQDAMQIVRDELAAEMVGWVWSGLMILLMRCRYKMHVTRELCMG